MPCPRAIELARQYPRFSLITVVLGQASQALLGQTSEIKGHALPDGQSPIFTPCPRPHRAVCLALLLPFAGYDRISHGPFPPDLSCVEGRSSSICLLPPLYLTSQTMDVKHNEMEEIPPKHDNTFPSDQQSIDEKPTVEKAEDVISERGDRVYVPNLVPRYTKEEEEAVIRKLDWHILPLIFALYSLSVLDRSNLGNARIAGMEDDIDLSGKKYDWLGTAFYISCESIPSALVVPFPNLQAQSHRRD